MQLNVETSDEWKNFLEFPLKDKCLSLPIRDREYHMQDLLMGIKLSINHWNMKEEMRVCFSPILCHFRIENKETHRHSYTYTLKFSHGYSTKEFSAVISCLGYQKIIENVQKDLVSSINYIDGFLPDYTTTGQKRIFCKEAPWALWPPDEFCKRMEKYTTIAYAEYSDWCGRLVGA